MVVCLRMFSLKYEPFAKRVQTSEKSAGGSWNNWFQLPTKKYRSTLKILTFSKKKKKVPRFIWPSRYLTINLNTNGGLEISADIMNNNFLRLMYSHVDIKFLYAHGYYSYSFYSFFLQHHCAPPLKGLLPRANR